MSQPGYERDDAQIRRERAGNEVSDALLTLEHCLATAKRGHKIVAKDGADVNAELALAALIRDLDRLRKRFTQDTLYASDPRLI